MNPETTKNESIEQQANAYELSEQDLDNVAGGQANVVNSSRSNIKGNSTTTLPPSTQLSPSTPPLSPAC
jgi:hypothetical protein